MSFEINDEHKIRFTLSERAMCVLSEDMELFNIPKLSTLINTIFSNFYESANSSIANIKEKKYHDMREALININIDDSEKNKIISLICSDEYNKIKTKIEGYKQLKGINKLYHINNDNIKYLSSEECKEDIEYPNKPGAYIRAVIEEYCELPFIKRERIIKKQLYTVVKNACLSKQVLKIYANYQNKSQLFYVYPYKIVPDSTNTQDYLVCYSRKAEDNERDKIMASFSMAKLNMPTRLSNTFSFTKQQITDIENALITHSAAYFVGKTEQIKVRLTDSGKQLFKTKLISRPQKIKTETTYEKDDTYVFNCTQQQIFNYFFSFGGNAEIISPQELRNRFIQTYSNALKQYKQK